MHKILGSQGFHRKLFALLFGLLLSTTSAWAATTPSWLLIMPGQSYSGSAQPNRYYSVTQVAGETITGIEAYCYNSASPYAPYSSFGYTTYITSTTPITVNPSGVWSSPALPTSFASVAYSQRTGITMTIVPAASGYVTLNMVKVNTGDPAADINTIYVQRITNFVITPGTFTAGQSGTIHIEARDGSGICTAYNGTVALSCLDGGVNGTTVSLGNITFTNGVYDGSVTLYHATPCARFQVTKSNTPAVTSYSSSFTISPSTFANLLVIGPGQSISCGSSSGNGRSSASTQTSSQVAGVPFSVSVYAVDAYWNTITATTTVTLTSTNDVNLYVPSSLAFGSTSMVRFDGVEFHTVGTGTKNLTANEGTHSGTDNVPLAAASLDHFSINDLSAQKTAGVAFTFAAYGWDAYGNTVSSVGGTTDLEILEGGTTPLSWTYRSVTISAAFNSSSFSGDGNFTGTLIVRKRATGYVVRIKNTVIGDTDFTDDQFKFNVQAGSAYYNMVVMPGQTHTPGEYHSGWGRNGSATARTAGTAFTATVLTTDQFGNIVDDTRSLTWSGATNCTGMADASATCSPNPIVITSGTAPVNFTLTVAYSAQVLSLPNSGLTVRDSGSFVVNSASLDHFSISAGTSQTAGVSFGTVITARDVYNNAVTSYSGTVYLTCPNLDYSVPTESVIQTGIGYPYYTSVSNTASWRLTGFVNGILNGTGGFNTTIYRAGSSQLFVSTNPEDKPSSSSGYVGSSSTITVSARTGGVNWKVFMILPGLQYRPGSIGSSGLGSFAGIGYTGTPLSQQLGSAFSVTVYATDAYFNNIATSNDQFLTVSNPSRSQVNINGQTYSLVNGICQKNVTITYADTYSFTVSSGTGYDPTTTPAITIFNIDHFSMELTAGGAIPSLWQAGHPINVSICAYSDAVNPATSFDGNATLNFSLDHSSTLKTIRPSTPILFTNGVWQGQVTLFRSSRNESEQNAIKIDFGSVETTYAVRVAHDDNSTNPYKLLIVAPGMTAYPGLNPDVWPDFKGADGQPSVQTAGVGITSLGFYLCDNWWNQVTRTAGTSPATGVIKIECWDPHPATVGGTALTGGTYINVTLGTSAPNDGGIQYGKWVATLNNTATAFVLYTVNGTTGQSIRVSDSAGSTSFELGSGSFNAIPVKHQDWIQSNESNFGFQFIMSTSAKTAGVPFSVTVAAIDAYGNTLDSLNGATAMPTYKEVALTAKNDGGGNRSIWPVKLGTLELTKWTEGVSNPMVYCYKYAAGDENITAACDFGNGSCSDESHSYSVLPNAYARVVPIIKKTSSTGMKHPSDSGAGGTYSYSSAYDSQPPAASASIFNNFGTPDTQTAGTQPTFLLGYTCDIYGNIVTYPIVNISLASTDRFAPLPANQSTLGTTSGKGYASFNYAFHTQGTATLTMADATITTMTAGTTPTITIVHGTAYGLQILSPGLVVVEGSGNSGTGGDEPGWYSGVTPTDLAITPLNSYNGRAQYAGSPFGVTVQMADMYGNVIGSGSDSIRLISDDIDTTNAVPSYTVPINASMTNGSAYFSSIQLYSPGARNLYPSDTTNPWTASTPLGIVGKPNSFCTVRIVQGTDTKFVAFVNGVKVEDNTPVYLEAAPNTFNVHVEVHYTGTGEVVSSNQSFIMEPFLNQSTPPTAAGGTLLKTNGATTWGVADVTGQTYSTAENIFIRIRDAAGSGQPAIGFSPELRFKASAPATITMWTDAVANQTQANTTSRVYARIYDANNPPNPISDIPVTMTILNQDQTTSYLEVPTGGGSTDSTGTTYAIFHAGAQNLSHVIQATAGSVTGQLTMFVTVTSNGGVYPNPFNPTQQSAHIDYRLDQNASVKVMAYTLFGDLVWSKDFAAGSDGGTAGVCSVLWDGKNNVGQTVANGGYIIVVKVNDREKYRFKLGVYKGSK